MTFDYSQIIPSDIPAKLRGESLDAGAKAQRDNNLEFLQEQHTAALQNLSGVCFVGNCDHNIEIVSASTRALNAIKYMVTGQLPSLSQGKSAGRSI